MKKIEDIKEEYDRLFDDGEELYRDSVHNKEDFQMLLEVGILDAKENIHTLEREKKDNSKIKLISKLENYLQLGDSSTESYIKEDNKIIDEAFELSLQYLDYMNRMNKGVDDNNYLDLLKLMIFSLGYYNIHMSYLEEQRNVLDALYQGFTYSNYQFEDNRKVFQEFMEQKLKEYISGEKEISSKNIEKVIKM